jgi:hypothetical protein
MTAHALKGQKAEAVSADSRGGSGPGELDQSALDRISELNAHRAEWSELIDRIKVASAFKDAPDKRAIIDFFWKRYPDALSDIDLEVEFFGNRQPREAIEGGRSRVALGDVRNRLKQFRTETRGEKWLLGISKGRGGYQLVFSLADRPLSATQSFWNAHLRSFEDPILISGSHMFFFDMLSNKITRYYDFNVADSSKEAILAKLISAYPEASDPERGISTLEPWRDLYLSSGDVHAHEAFLKWFHRESESRILMTRITCRQITIGEISRKNAILIGRPQTNPIIGKLMDSPPQATKFAFRIHPLKGALQITNLNPRDLADLNRFPISPDGMVGPILQDGKVFGVFTRFPNPGGRGHITIISCGHYAMIIARIVEAMTNDVQATELLKRMGWPLNEPLPEAFEMIFTVDLSPGGLEGEGFPQLVTWRHC